MISSSTVGQHGRPLSTGRRHAKDDSPRGTLPGAASVPAGINPVTGTQYARQWQTSRRTVAATGVTHNSTTQVAGLGGHPLADIYLVNTQHQR